MPRILLIDTLYPDFIRTLPDPIDGTYETELQRVLDLKFGTSDFWSRNLKTQGWETCDVIANHPRLQYRWALENNFGPASDRAKALQQIEAFQPDVVFMQDLSYFDAATLRMLRNRYVLAGQCSCPMPKAENVEKFHVLMTSFPHYVPRFKAMGVPFVEYLPLAFEASMLGPEVPRDYDISFVGGIGKKSHWKAGTDVLERVAEHFKERFIWFGYGVENLEKGSPLLSRYAGSAWGRALYEVYARSKVVINRHGEVAEGYANNLRMFEATGMGAVLFTEAAPNLYDLFDIGFVGDYDSPEQLVRKASNALDEWYPYMGSVSQVRTLATHNYGVRMKVVSDVLLSCLKVAA